MDTLDNTCYTDSSGISRAVMRGSIGCIGPLVVSCRVLSGMCEITAQYSRAGLVQT